MSNGKAPPVTNLETLFEELDAGIYAQKLAAALSDVALGVASVDSKRKGKVIAEFTIQRIGESRQVQVTHKLKYVRPTAKGVLSEESTASTPMHVGPRGALSLIPDTQQSLFAEKDKDRE